LGYRDVEQQTKPDSDTIYHVASPTKAMTSMTFGIAVENGLADWDTLIRTVYPDFQLANETVRSEATITDLLAHRTSLAGKKCY
jgi:CubicO group peptidase (beta-lactamase class C family)